MIKLNGKEVQFEQFPNGETKMLHEDMIIEDHSHIDFKYENDSDLIKLLFVKNYIDDVYPDTSIDLIVYYNPYSRMDRSENNSPFTLKYVSSFINGLNFKTITVLEPHSDVSCALLNRSNPISINFKLLPEVLKEIGFDKENDYIVFPDVTSNKRYGDVDIENRLTGLKKRDFKTGRIKSLDLVGNISKKGFKALMIDDLSSYGGTFLMTAKRLIELGATEIYLLVGHCEDSIFDGDVFKTDLISKVFTTDTILTKQNYIHNLKHKERIKIFNVEDVLNGSKL